MNKIESFNHIQNLIKKYDKQYQQTGKLCPIMGAEIDKLILEYRRQDASQKTSSS